MLKNNNEKKVFTLWCWFSSCYRLKTKVLPTWNSHDVNIMTKHLCMLMNKQLITICTYHVRRMQCAYKSAYNYFQQKLHKQTIDIGSSLIFPCSPCQTHPHTYTSFCRIWIKYSTENTWHDTISLKSPQSVYFLSVSCQLLSGRSLFICR